MKADRTAIADQLIAGGLHPDKARLVVEGIEWLDHPFTKRFFDYLDERHDQYDEQYGSTYVPGNPNATQEAMAQIRGSQFELEQLSDMAELPEVDFSDTQMADFAVEVFCGTDD